MIFKGSGVALITPFTNDDKINYDKLKMLIDFHIKNKTDAIIICGTTGEAATLDENEKKKLIKFSIEYAKTKIPIIIGTGSNDTKKALELSMYADKLKPDALLIVTPYYNKCTQEGLYLHYKKINDCIDTPIILYNVPSRTGVDIDVSTIVKLAKLKNIVGIKEASQDITKIAKITSNCDEEFSVYSGNDDMLLASLAHGAKGIISVAANIIPKQIHDICDLALNNDMQKARKMYLNYYDLIKALFIEVNPIPIKYAMNNLGFDVGSLRLPLTNLSKNNQIIIDDLLKKIK